MSTNWSMSWRLVQLPREWWRPDRVLRLSTTIENSILF